ncbi:hypothetical protein QTP88_006743 [Uroleucon formosanum]
MTVNGVSRRLLTPPLLSPYTITSSNVNFLVTSWLITSNDNEPSFSCVKVERESNNTHCENREFLFVIETKRKKRGVHCAAAKGRPHASAHTHSNTMDESF